MFPTRWIVLSALVSGLTVAVAGSAAAESFEIDPDHTSISFVVDHLGYSNVIGRFNTVSGTLEFDESNPEAARVALVIDAASIDTNHQKRDDHLRSPDFFNTAEFPEITYTNTGIEITGEKTAKITGDFTMLGVTLPVVMDVVFNQVSPFPMNPDQIRTGFSGRGTLKRSDFGMTYAVDGIGDEIMLMVEVEAVR